MVSAFGFEPKGCGFESHRLYFLISSGNWLSSECSLLSDTRIYILARLMGRHRMVLISISKVL